MPLSYVRRVLTRWLRRFPLVMAWCAVAVFPALAPAQSMSPLSWQAIHVQLGAVNRRTSADDPVYDSVRFDVRGPARERWTTTAQLHRDFPDAAEEGHANFPDDFRVVQPDGSLGSPQRIYNLPLGTFTWTYHMGPHTADGSFRLVTAENGATVAFVDNMSQRSLAKPYEPSAASSGSRDASTSPITGDIRGNLGGGLPDPSPSDKDRPDGDVTRRVAGSAGPGWWGPALLAGLLMGGVGFVLGRRRPAAGGTDERGGARAIPTRTAARRAPGAVVAAREETMPQVPQASQASHGAPSAGANPGEGRGATLDIAHAARVAGAAPAHAVAQQAPEASSSSAAPAGPPAPVQFAAPAASADPAVPPTPAVASAPSSPIAAGTTPPEAHDAPRRLLDPSSRPAAPRASDDPDTRPAVTRRPVAFAAGMPRSRARSGATGSGGAQAGGATRLGDAADARAGAAGALLSFLEELRVRPRTLAAVGGALVLLYLLGGPLVMLLSFTREGGSGVSLSPFAPCSYPLECQIKAESIWNIWLPQEMERRMQRGDSSGGGEAGLEAYEKQLKYYDRACELSGPESPVCVRTKYIREKMLPDYKAELERLRARH